MKAITVDRGWIVWIATLAGVMGLLLEMPTSVAEQPNLPQQPAQLVELEEVEWLSKQRIQLFNEGKYSAAIPLAARTLAIVEKVLGPEHPDVATSLNNLAELYRAQRNYPKAEQLHHRALAIREKVLGPEHPDVTQSLKNLAGLYSSQGNYPKAAQLHQRVLAIQEKVLGPEHPDVATSLDNLARLYQAQGDIDRAIEFLNRSSSIQEYNLALVLATESESQKRDYMATLSDQTDATISLHVEAGPENPIAAYSALTTILQRKGRVLDDLTSSLQALRQRLQPEDQTLLDQLALVRSQQAALVFQLPKHIPSDQYRNQLSNLAYRAEHLEATLSRRSAQFRTQSQPVTLSAVWKLIPSDAALVELVSYKPYNPKATTAAERFGAPRYIAYVLNHHQNYPAWVDLGDAETLNIAVADFRRAIRDPRRLPVKQVARTLDKKLMQPIRRLLRGTRTVLLSPDSQLNLIPFAALVDENNEYLLENYTITYLSSGRDLLRLQTHFSSRQGPVLFANPNFDQPDNLALVPPSSASRSPNNQRSTNLVELRFAPLIGTAMEAKAIAPMLTGVKLLTGSDASENALKQLYGPSILHIATHGFFLKQQASVLASVHNQTGSQSLIDDRPNSAATLPENSLLRSGLALAGFNLRRSGSEDGVLTALEAAGLDLSGTKLVVLSACDTGVGDIINGEGVYGLRRALVTAGAESQVLSLWQVDDLGTKDLMVSYYQRLSRNVGRSAALHQTQLEMLRTPQYEHPYYWAAFIPSGDWTSMGEASFSKQSNSAM